MTPLMLGAISVKILLCFTLTLSFPYSVTLSFCGAVFLWGSLPLMSFSCEFEVILMLGCLTTGGEEGIRKAHKKGLCNIWMFTSIGIMHQESLENNIQSIIILLETETKSLCFLPRHSNLSLHFPSHSQTNLVTLQKSDGLIKEQEL